MLFHSFPGAVCTSRALDSPSAPSLGDVCEVSHCALGLPPRPPAKAKLYRPKPASELTWGAGRWGGELSSVWALGMETEGSRGENPLTEVEATGRAGGCPGHSVHGTVEPWPRGLLS